MEKMYAGLTPDDILWNIETPPEILVTRISGNLPRPCKVIESGCGAGNYVICFAKNGFEATGVDISENIIHRV
jgi:2-polyprenyl-3-methyl-5-hydroxy-6-metoxy-1,4-benzoquinol methylase